MESYEATPFKRTLPVEFNGNGFEYFKIWIVNLCLSVITLGIYSAWAKVRRISYFYGNTRIDGHSFSYLADPVKILIGRIIHGGMIGPNAFALPDGTVVLTG
jgi:uncharacterized membrane protein YjgN (DUF898 family)